MRRLTLIVAALLAGAVFLLYSESAECATPPDGMYIGVTDQGRGFEVRVSNGEIDQWYVNFAISCQYGSVSGGVRTTISPTCAIEEDGSFVCGGTTCPSYSGGVRSEIGGVFATDNSVSGTIEIAARIGPSPCCYLTAAFEADLFVTEIFDDGFESGDCVEWAKEVP